MAKSASQKKKLVILWRFLWRETDEDHPASMAALLSELAAWGVSAERKSIYDDLEALGELGLDVQCRRGRGGGWFLGQREFELAELKLLVDAVQSSRFLTERKSAALIRKLEGLTSRHQAGQLQRQVFVDRRIKTMNESIFYNVDRLHAAIARGREVTFRYFDYNIEKQRIFRRNGARYRVSPCGLIWDSENYYLAGYDAPSGQVRHYRVDKMSDITVEKRERTVPAGWNARGYAGRHFGMFAGPSAAVRLRCRQELAGVMVDRFGKDAVMAPDGPEHFTVTVDVAVSRTFYGWLFGLGEGVRILEPEWAAREFARMARAVEEEHGGEAAAENEAPRG